MRLVSRLDRYIGRTVFFSTLFVLFLLLLLLSFTVFVDALDDLGRGNFGMVELIRYTVLSQPKGLYQLFPTAALLGGTLGLSYLAANAELVAIRAAGVSLWRTALAVIKVGAVFVVAGILIGEYVAPKAEEAAQRGRAEALGTGFRGPRTGLWLRNGLEFINIEEVLPDQSLLNITITQFDQDGEMRSQIHAQRGHYRDNDWRLSNVTRINLSGDRIDTTKSDKLDWSVALTPKDMAVFMVRPEALSVYHLHHYLNHLRKNAQQTDRFELVFWRKIFSPFSIVVMLLLAIPFVFAQHRSGTLGKQMFIGLMIALLFNMFNYGMGHAAVLLNIPAIVGAVLPLALFFVLAVFLIRRFS